jgi:preprotein translocase subunit SecG
MSLLNYVTILSAILMIVLILVQTRGATLGAGFGGGADINTVRRGSDKTIFQLTILMATVFALSILLTIIIK